MTDKQKEHLERSWERITEGLDVTSLDKMNFFIGAEAALLMNEMYPELAKEPEQEEEGDAEGTVEDDLTTIYTEDTYSDEVKFYGRI